MADGIFGDIAHIVGSTVQGQDGHGLAEQLAPVIESVGGISANLGHVLEALPIGPETHLLDAHLLDAMPSDFGPAIEAIQATDAVDAQGAGHVYDAVHDADTWAAHADGSHVDAPHVDAPHVEPVAHDAGDVTHDADSAA